MYNDLYNAFCCRLPVLLLLLLMISFEIVLLLEVRKKILDWNKFSSWLFLFKEKNHVKSTIENIVLRQISKLIYFSTFLPIYVQKFLLAVFLSLIRSVWCRSVECRYHLPNITSSKWDKIDVIIVFLSSINKNLTKLLEITKQFPTIWWWWFPKRVRDRMSVKLRGNKKSLDFCFLILKFKNICR